VKQSYVYAGISGVTLEPETFDLGEGIVLTRTYAHLMSPCLMAFAPPGPQGHHPAPWKAAKGGFSFDIQVELKVPSSTRLGDSLNAREVVWLIAALLRVLQWAFLTVPVLSDHPFHLVPKIDEEPTLEPFETQHRIFQVVDPAMQTLGINALSYVKEKWISVARLLCSNSKFYTAMKAFDSATVSGRSSSSMLALWGAIEQLFAPSRAELRFRVASLLASYLEREGNKRFELYKKVLKLYDVRSIAAHTAQEVDSDPIVHTYVLMRNALARMIDEVAVPSQDDLERLLFVAPLG
jgi:hypothetical protein